MSDDGLAWLMRWYLAECNDDWEHSCGLKIDTVDNPGWSLKIDLRETELEGKFFQRIAAGEPASDLEEWQKLGSWWVADVKDNMFEAACGPHRIAHLLCEFAIRMEAARMGKHNEYTLPMTPEQLADCTGLTPVHVNRMLKAVAADGSSAARPERHYR